MEPIHISALNPELPALDSKHIKATVTLIWPYSSSARQFALLLAEPEFRLRRKKGQVRARFLGSSAKAIASTGVGIGDEVVLGLRGADFVREGAVSTPGKSVDWELVYTQTIAVQIFRDGASIANLALLDAAPTPAPSSPVRQGTVGPRSSAQWSSPAISRLPRLSGSSLFGDDLHEGRETKRRRTSYGRRITWTFSARPPSPDVEDTDIRDEYLNLVAATPSRVLQLPRTPTSPIKVAAGNQIEGGTVHGTSRPTIDTDEIVYDGPVTEDRTADPAMSRQSRRSRIVSEADHDKLYAGADDMPSSDAQYAFGGDTEADTEANTSVEDTDEPTVDSINASTTAANTEEYTESLSQLIDDLIDDDTEQGSSDEEHVVVDEEVDSADESPSESNHVRLQTASSPLASVPQTDGINEFVESAREGGGMPPPLLPLLQTDFSAPVVAAPSTVSGLAPASPTLRPLNSATLPLPSPFPDQRASDALSSSHDIAVDQEAVVLDSAKDDAEARPDDADYICETSFFSSIGSSRASGLHPDHESVFTPVRFGFGLDGMGWSRPLDIPSSPVSNTERPMGIETQSLIVPTIEDAQVNPDFGISARPLPESAWPLSSDRAQSTEDPEPAATGLSSDPTEEVIETLESDILYTLNVNAHEHHMDIDHEESDKANAYKLEAPTTSHHTFLEDSRSQAHARDIGAAETKHSVRATEIVDLGSPSKDDSDEEEAAVEEPAQVYHDEDEAGATSITPTTDLNSVQELLDDLIPSDDAVQPRDVEAHGDFIHHRTMEPVSSATHHSHTKDHSQVTRGTQSHNDSPVIDETPLFKRLTSQLPSDEMDQDTVKTLQEEQLPMAKDDETHVDVKMESVEDDPFMSSVELSGELLIEVPEEGNKIGDLHTISVPATGPARNTRSKTKTSTSPAKEAASTPRRTTRSLRSGASITSIAPTSVSPSRTRARSTVSPSRGASQTSPYSLRSQSKLLSPVASTFPNTSMRRSPRKYASQQTVHGVPDIPLSQVDLFDASTKLFEVLQEPNASQGRYSNVSFVKDSEEESVRSEQSISTVRYSNEWPEAGTRYENLSDPLDHTARDDKISSLKPPPASAPEPRTRSRRRKATPQSDQIEVIELLSSGSARQLRSSSSKAAASQYASGTAPRGRSRSHSKVQDISQESTSRAATVRIRGERDHTMQISPPPQTQDLDMADFIRSSRPVANTLIHRDTEPDPNKVITSDDTQVTNMSTQSSVDAMSHVQHSRLTPDLTQATSAGLRSFQADAVDPKMAAVDTTRSQASPYSKSTPRRNVTATDVASRSASPQANDPSLVAKSEKASPVPAIGLSTPLAYYTPLRDIRFFLNRSSQYVSSSNPDFLALVTQSTTPPARAKKGPKHWNTTLHITDASIYPASTTVNIFRAYQDALPVADVGDVVLFRSFGVKSLNRTPALVSDQESSWCVWRYGRPSWNKKRGPYGEVRAREEVKGPEVERAEGEWKEVERIREWFVRKIKEELKKNEHGEEDEVEVEGV